MAQQETCESSREPVQGYAGNRGCFFGCIAVPVVCTAVWLLSVAIPLETHRHNYEKWLGHNITNYTITVSDPSGGVRTSTVHNGTLVDDGYPYHAPLIEDLFESAIRCSGKIVLSCTVLYEETYGFPVRIEIPDLEFDQILEVLEFQIETSESQADE